MPVETMTAEQDKELMQQLDRFVKDPRPVIKSDADGYAFVQDNEYSDTFTSPSACVLAAMMHNPPNGECHHKTLIVNIKMGVFTPLFKMSIQHMHMFRCPKCKSEPVMLLSNAFIGPILEE